MGLFGAGDPPCPAGSICSGQARTKVGVTFRNVNVEQPDGSTKVVKQPRGGTGIYHASATKLNTDGTATTDVYIIKDGKWQKAATTTNGGKTYTYDDDVAGAGLRKELSDPQGAIHKNVNAGINIAADEASLPPTEKAKLLESNKNAALVDEKTGDGENPAGDDSGSSRPIPPIENEAGTKKDFGNLNYPETRDPGQDIIKFDMLKYEPRKLGTGGGAGFGFQDRSDLSKRKSIGSVTLPIPGGIADANACDWGRDTMNALQIAGIKTLMTPEILGGKNAGGSFGDALGGIVDDIKKNVPAVTGAIGAAAASSALGTNINSLLGRTQGMILNPNLELLFQRPSLRPFSFQFKLSPRSRTEAKEIVKIIRFFKQGMAPIRENSRLFLRTPNTFRIKYVQLGNDSESSFMNKFKECALLSCNVQYTPEGNYAPYEDGAMSSYVMSLQFKELEPVYSDDYGDKDVTAVGF